MSLVWSRVCWKLCQPLILGLSWHRLWYEAKIRIETTGLCIGTMGSSGSIHGSVPSSTDFHAIKDTHKKAAHQKLPKALHSSCAGPSHCKCTLSNLISSALKTKPLSKDAGTRWAPASCKWSYKPYKWPYRWVTLVITQLITGRGPPGRYIFIYHPYNRPVIGGWYFLQYWDVLLVLRINGLFHPYISRLVYKSLIKRL